MCFLNYYNFYEYFWMIFMCIFISIYLDDIGQFWQALKSLLKGTFPMVILLKTGMISRAHTTFWKSITKVTPFSNKGPILHRDSISFHLSHQPPLSVMCHFLCSESDTFPPKSDIFTT